MLTLPVKRSAKIVSRVVGMKLASSLKSKAFDFFVYPAAINIMSLERVFNDYRS
ncbi:hypothetical protein ACW9H6_13785 [Pseudomonas sp. SDO528_S397]